MRFGSFCAATVVAAVAFAVPAFAQNGAAIDGVTKAGTKGGKVETMTNLFPINTIIRRDAGTPSAIAGGVLHGLDRELTITCPKKPAGACVIESEITVQVASTGGQPNRLELCTLLNDKGMSNPDLCLYAAVIPTTSSTGLFLT